MATRLTKPLASYRHTRHAGALVFLAGQGCRNPKTNECVGLTRSASGEVVDYDITEQTRGVFLNIERVLAAEDLNRSHLLDVTVFLKDMKDFDKMNAVWNEYFVDGSSPTRTTVAVLDLPDHNFIEMKAIALRPRG